MAPGRQMGVKIERERFVVIPAKLFLQQAPAIQLERGLAFGGIKIEVASDREAQGTTFGVWAS